MEITVPRRRLPKGSHKGRQMAHNQKTGKYVRQRERTARNKAAARKEHLEHHPNDLQARKHLL
jgi:hypothetical protein